MCGIVGISGPVDKEKLEKAIHSIAHRGPDDKGIFIDGDSDIGLGHTRLSIIELTSLGHQPMLSDNESVVIVFNGEIYNFILLRKELEKKGHEFKGRSDTEVLLKMYLEHGIDFLSKLNGIFALAIFDKNKQELFLARDGIGVKPVYYYSDNDTVAFSSEIKSLLYLIPEDLDLDYQSIQRYLTFLWCPGEGTPINSVKKVLPGEILKIKDGRIVKKWRWYVHPQTKHLPKVKNKKTAINLLRKKLEIAVDRQMIADVPVGAFLSGGLDSSAIVALASKHNPNISCFTIEPHGGSDSDVTEDLPYAKKVAKYLNVDLEVVTIHSQNISDEIEQMIWQLDEPLADPAPLNVLYISRLARKRGIKVLLSGAGGDDLFTGYRRHLAHKYEKYWSWMPSILRHKLDNFSQKVNQKNSFGRRLNRLFQYAGEDATTRLINYFAWARRSDLLPLYNQDTKRIIKNVRAEQPIFDFFETIDSNVSSMDSLLALEQQFFLADHNLIYTDKMSMAAGLEVRVPFLDTDLVDFAARIPDKYKQNGRSGKWILKKAMEQYLPNDVIYRPKTGFGAPLRRWIKYDLKDMINEYLSKKSIENRQLFDSRNISRLIKENDRGYRDNTYILFSLLCIEIWCRRYLDK